MRKKDQKPLSNETIAQIIWLRLKGLRVQQIAVIMHKEHNVILNVLKQYGLAIGDGHRTKINEVYNKLRVMNAQGLTVKEIADQFGLLRKCG